MFIALNDFLSWEITFVPQVLSNYFGKFYSNSVCNGCTWLFIIWYIMHCGLDFLVNEVLRKMKYKEYNRIRLKNSIWYLGFYCTAFVHTCSLFFQNRFDVPGMRRMNVTTYNDVSSDIVTGFMVLFSFFLHSALWEAMEYDSKVLFFSYILLCGVLAISFMLRTLEVAFTLTAFISLTQVSIQSTKLLFVITKQKNSYFRIIITVFFGFGVCSFCLSYLIGVPLVFLIPFCRNIVTAHLPSSFIPLILVICGWYVSEIGNSPLYKLLAHWLFHREQPNECCGNVVECSLFPPRNDMAYNMLQLRREIKEREERRLSLRRTSRKGALAQTIKCVVSLKRKIQAKREAAKQDLETHLPIENNMKSDENAKLLTVQENTTSEIENSENDFYNSLKNSSEKNDEEIDNDENEYRASTSYSNSTEKTGENMN